MFRVDRRIFFLKRQSNMNRPKQYVREEVLEKATSLFWVKGFEATSMSEMETKTGIKKFSPYNEFGNKSKLFLACIDHFLNNYCQMEEILSKKPLGLINIEAFFKYKISIYHSYGNKGCLVFNSVMEKEVISKEAALKVDEFLSKMKILYLNCLKAAQKKKEINNKNCDALADYMCNFTYGFVNLGMKRMNEKELNESVNLALKVIKD